MTNNLVNLVPFFAFGFWSLLCVIFGAWLSRRLTLGQSIAPEFNPKEMFNWIRTGKPDDAETEYQPPLLDDKDEDSRASFFKL